MVEGLRVNELNILFLRLRIEKYVNIPNLIQFINYLKSLSFRKVPYTPCIIYVLFSIDNIYKIRRDPYSVRMGILSGGQERMFRGH